MATFLVMVHRSGPAFQPGVALEQQTGWDEHAAFMDGLVEDGFILLGGPLDDPVRVVHVVEAASAAAVRARFADDPWSGSHLLVHSVERWTLRLDGREHWAATSRSGRPAAST
jgi:hypothetical protein